MVLLGRVRLQLKLFELNDHFENTDINSIILSGCKEGV